MNISVDEVKDPMTTDSTSRLVLLCVTLALLFYLFWHSFVSMVDIWWRSETFAHGFVIFPISIYLIWRLRSKLGTVEFVSDRRALVFLAGAGMTWLIARMASVLVVEQLAFVAMIPLLVWLYLGVGTLRTLMFPLFFLFFSVPMGESLILPLMHFTADFTVHAIRLTGIPVYSEGTFFSIPSGDWSVVEGCSGVRYLIASVTLGVLYAYLSYHSIWRRLAFVVMAIIFPVIANGLRAFLIVMIADLSDMKLALGFDHIIYGWVFFGFVIFIMFWIGSLWREPAEVNSGEASIGEGVIQARNLPDSASPSLPRLFATVVFPGLLFISIWPLWQALSTVPVHPASNNVAINLPDKAGAWTKMNEVQTNWRPIYVHPTLTKMASYRKGKDTVGVFVAYYSHQTQGMELVNTQNVFVKQKDPNWIQAKLDSHAAIIDDKNLAITEGVLKSQGQDLLAWKWNWVGGYPTDSALFGKFLEIKSKLQGDHGKGFSIVVFTEVDSDVNSSRHLLQSFISESYPFIKNSILQR